MLIENRTKGKPAMVVGAMIAILGLIIGKGFLLIIGFGIFIIGKIIYWFFNE